MAGLADPHDSLERPYDAVISISGVQFKVQKTILCGCSAYFRALFFHHSPDRKEFEVPGLSAAIMHLINEFAYEGSVSVTEDNVQELLEAADQFSITGIERACCDFLQERLSPENCIGIWHFCNICHCPELQKKAYRYLLIHFEEVVSREEFQQLSVQELSGILDSDELNVRRETTLCEAIFEWVDYEPAERQQHFSVLLSKVRLALTSQCFIAELMNTEAVSSSAECMEIVRQAQKLKTCMSMLTPSLSACSNQAGRPRLPNAILFAIGGYFHGVSTKVTEVYDFHADRWNTLSYRGAHRHANHGTVHCNNSVYCVGGILGLKTTNTVYQLDLTTHTWLQVASMHHCRKNVSVTALDGFIYAVGGFDGRSCLSSAERYNPETNQWSFIASMHAQRSSASCTVLHDKIYICGGFNWYGSLGTCEYYCPETDQWTKFTSMSSRRFRHGVIAYEDLIFAVGGTHSNGVLNSVEAYDPRTKSWQAVPSMLTSRHSFGIAVIDNKLFAVGGLQLTSKTGSVEYYDRSTNLWSEACEMEAPRHALSCCVVSGLTNVAEHVISRDNLQRLDEKEDLVESRHSM